MERDLQEDKNLKSFNDALQLGVEYVKEGDREIRYRSFEDLLRIRNLMVNASGRRKEKLTKD